MGRAPNSDRGGGLGAAGGAAARGGLGAVVQRWRWGVALAWVALVATLMVFASASGGAVGQATALLPDDMPSRVAVDELGKYFGAKVGHSQAAIVFERAAGALTADDLRDIERVATSVKLLEGRGVVAVRSPGSLGLPPRVNPLVSADGRAALVVASLPHDFSTAPTATMVDEIQARLSASPLPAGVTARITGSAGYGHDYAVANERSHRNTLLVTLIAVVGILLIVYRAPLAALIPLAGISMATIVAVKLLALGTHMGLQSGTSERIFVLVLVYGAGVDYSLLFLGRYAELLSAGRSSGAAVIEGLNRSVVAIVFSATTTVAGLGMLWFARFGVFHNTGFAVMLSLVVAAVGALTVVPAIVAIIGPKVFWPTRLGRPLAGTGAAQGRFWPALAHVVVKRPGTILAAALLVLILPALQGSRLTWVYDALASLKPHYEAVQGTEMVKRHWPIGEVAPLTVLAVAPEGQSPEKWKAAYGQIVAGLRSVDVVANVRGVGTPLGGHVSAMDSTALWLLAGKQMQAEYLSADGRAMRFSAVFGIAPLNLGAFDGAAHVRQTVVQALAKAGIPAKVHLAGATAEMADIRAITQGDFYLVAGLALAAILVLVVVMLRDVILATFMVAATVLSYLATLGITSWVFQSLGYVGLDWKVQVFLFVVLVAVGQDYNIFFAVRLAQEALTLPAREATARTIVTTGSVISCCGLIMAATLGSVMAGDITLLVQLGFAFALGMLLDTFIVRPLMLPAFIVLARRDLRNVAGFVK